MIFSLKFRFKSDILHLFPYLFLPQFRNLIIFFKLTLYYFLIYFLNRSLNLSFRCMGSNWLLYVLFQFRVKYIYKLFLLNHSLVLLFLLLYQFFYILIYKFSVIQLLFFGKFLLLLTYLFLVWFLVPNVLQVFFEVFSFSL